MAVIQKLRNSGWVAVVIIVALVMFVVGDWLSGNNSPQGDENRDVIAEMNAEKVREKELLEIANELYITEKENDPEYEITDKNRGELFQKAWNQLLKNKLIYTQIKKAGIEVTDEDYNEMMVGVHPDESIQGDPSFQTDGKFDPKKVESIFRQAKGNAQMKARLADYVRKMKENELTVRYSTYLSKSTYKTKAEKKYEYIASNQSVTGKIVSLDVKSIPDKEIKATEDDFAAYLEEYKEKFKSNQEVRGFKYVVFDIVPSREDTMYAIKTAQSTAEGMKAGSPDTTTATPLVSRADLPKDAPLEISEVVWNSPLNSVVGPLYKEGKFYIWQKVKQKADTVAFVKASHILIPLSGQLPDGSNIKDSIEALKKAQEVYGMIQSGASMSELAGKYSTDQGSARNGGDLGWSNPNKFVPEFANFCKSAAPGQVGVVKTQYGFHIIKMVAGPDNTKISFVQNEVEITPGQQTVKIVDEKCRSFKNSIKSDFDKAVEKAGTLPRISKDFTTDQKTIPGIEAAADSRTIMYWLFDNKRAVGDVSEVFAFSNKQVIVKIENIKHVGYATVANVKSEIEPLVRERLKARKAADKLAKALETAKTAEALASSVKGLVTSLDGVRFGQNFIPQLGQESPVLGAAFGAKEKSTTIAFAGRNVAAVIFLDKRSTVSVPTSILNTQDQIDFMSQPQYLANRISEVLTKSANIQDYRYKFDWNQ